MEAEEKLHMKAFKEMELIVAWLSDAVALCNNEIVAMVVRLLN